MGAAAHALTSVQCRDQAWLHIHVLAKRQAFTPAAPGVAASAWAIISAWGASTLCASKQYSPPPTSVVQLFQVNTHPRSHRSDPPAGARHQAGDHSTHGRAVRIVQHVLLQLLLRLLLLLAILLADVMVVMVAAMVMTMEGFGAWKRI